MTLIKSKVHSDCHCCCCWLFWLIVFRNFRDYYAIELLRMERLVYILLHWHSSWLMMMVMWLLLLLIPRRVQSGRRAFLGRSRYKGRVCAWWWIIENRPGNVCPSLDWCPIRTVQLGTCKIGLGQQTTYKSRTLKEEILYSQTLARSSVCGWGAEHTATLSST